MTHLGDLGTTRRDVLGGLLLGVAGPQAWAVPPLLSQEFIDTGMTTPQVHASTVAELPDGSLLAAWFGGTAERAPDVRIWCARRLAGVWSPPQAVADGIQPDGKRLPTWNPVLFQAGVSQGGRLLLFYKVGPSPQQWWGELITSDDGGQHWSKPQRLPDGVLGPIRSKPLQLADGTLLCPSSTEDDQGHWRIHFERSQDLGRSWGGGAPVQDPRGLAMIQPSLVLRPDGSVLAFARSLSNRIAVTRSRDGGLTWSPPTLTPLPNPNAGIEALGLADGRLLMVFNPRERGRDWWNGRDRLDLALSGDGGRRWRTVFTLEDEPGQEFSYPAAIQSRDGSVHITYTYKRRQIRHVQLDPHRLG
ncbi:sialidase family protein [Roseateles sp.]|uniref:sialidase family protein n=1 Tax=Roseateles sp. TaxID=1971397 RepID=UPI002DF967B7|nr:sialidase family protein [Roseateles sp.]